jgi:hypothetical protein
MNTEKTFQKVGGFISTPVDLAERNEWDLSGAWMLEHSMDDEVYKAKCEDIHLKLYL